MKSTATPSLRSAFLLAVCLAPAASAAVIYTSGSLNLPIPDDTETGLVRTLTVAESFAVGSVNVSLNLSVPTGDTGWSGDLYAYLQHGTGLSVLLNRPGRDTGSPFGYDDSQGFAVSFADGAANGDIHRYRLGTTGSDAIRLSGTLTGAWQPDGRATDPGIVLAGDTRDAMLDQFAGATSAGGWTLFLADLSGGSRYRLDSWSLTINDVSPVPEPATVGLTAGAGLLAFAAWRRGRRSR